MEKGPIPMRMCNTDRTNLCRPMQDNTNYNPVYQRSFYENFNISLRPLCIETDVNFIYDWVNQEYAKRFWQMDGRPLQQLKEVYSNIAACNFAQSFVALLNNKPVCQLDVYNALHDEVSLQYNARRGDYGIHLIMAPREKTIAGLSASVLQTFLEYFFSYPEIKRIIGEPDAENQAANRLVTRLGFRFRHQVTMSYKTANLYTCTWENFQTAIQENYSITSSKCA